MLICIFFVSVDILSMRLHSNRGRKPSNTIKSAGQFLLSNAMFGSKVGSVGRKDDELSDIVEACLEGETAKPAAQSVCSKLANVLLDNSISFSDYPSLLISLAKKQPRVFLDTFFGFNEEENRAIARDFISYSDHYGNPLMTIEEKTLIDWCESKPSSRYVLITGSITPYWFDGENGPIKWTSLAQSLMENAPDTIVVLNQLRANMRPMSWSGSRAEVMEKRLPLLAELKSHKSQTIRDWAFNEERIFMEEIRMERESESRHNRFRDERFEWD